METPEKIYIEEPIEDTQSVFFGYPKKEPNANTKYIRSDIADTERNEFALFCYDAGRWGGERDVKKLYEMFNSRPR